VALVVTCVCWSAAAAPCSAASDVGAGSGTPDRADDPLRYRPPVQAPVVDPFRLPDGPYGAGNRGLEYRTTPGAPVRAIGAGAVVFAGQVAGRLVVSIDHPDGLRSSLVGLASIEVRAGEVVRGGDVVGRAAGVLHLGVRRDGRYLDPATLFDERGPARLVPSGRTVAGFGAARTPH
jgi:murein DD-endopeptidase MepM/ murein hydrolase activator NlpD